MDDFEQTLLIAGVVIIIVIIAAEFWCWANSTASYRDEYETCAQCPGDICDPRVCSHSTAPTIPISKDATLPIIRAKTFEGFAHEFGGES